ncbi:MAG: hypothetical protein WBV77_05065 [Solirubrobacteraceae bacterium]
MAVVLRNGSARQRAPREVAELNDEAPAHPGRQSHPSHDRRRKSLLHGALRPSGSTPATRRGQAAASPLTEVTLQTFQRWWFENSFDELKNDWGWGGFTTHDLARCRIMARIVALIFNWWNLFVRLADPDHHREAITSRPLLLQAIGRQTNHAGRATVTITSSHGERDRARRALTRIAAFFATLRETAEQLTDLDRWYRILSHALAKYLKGRQLDPPRRLQAA